MRSVTSGFSKREFGLALGAVALGGCATTPTTELVSDARRVMPYSASRQERLFSRFFKEPQSFTADFQRGPYSLSFVAADHSVDPAGATFREVRDTFSRVSPKSLILEGFPTSWGDNPEPISSMIPTRLQPDANSFAKGEGVYAASLAQSASVPFVGGEPTDAQQTEGLVALGFAAEDIYFVDMIKALFQDLRAGEFATPSDPNFAKAYEGWVRNSDAPARPIEAFRAWYSMSFGTSIESDPNWFERSDPGKRGIGADISRAQGLIRDRHLYALIIARLKAERAVMVVYGASHLTNLWSALAFSLGQPRVTAA
jgi:hypothetical protein